MPFDALDIADRATVLKPAVLVVTDWKKDTRSCVPVGSAEKSSKKKNAAGTTIRKPVMARITLLYTR